MKSKGTSVPNKNVGEEFNAGFMIEKEFMIFNKPVVFTTTNKWRPPTDVYETVDSFTIKMDISGVNTDSVNMYLRDGVLVINGKRDFNTTHSNTHFYQIDGLLIIHLPKADKSHYEKNSQFET